MFIFEARKSSRLGNFLYHSLRPHSRMYIRIYISNFKKQTSKKKSNTKKYAKIAKEAKEEKRLFLENWLKEINLRPLGWRFFSSPAFPETRVSFFFFFLLTPTGVSDSKRFSGNDNESKSLLSPFMTKSFKVPQGNVKTTI